MIISFEFTNIEDLNLMVQLANRLGVKQIDLNDKKIVPSNNPTTEINDEIDNIFGIDNSDIFY